MSTSIQPKRSPQAVAANLAAEYDPAWIRAVIHHLDESLQISALDRLITLWRISAADAARFFGVSRQAFAKWQAVGPPSDRAPAILALSDATDLLVRHVKRERIGAVVRRPSALTRGRSLLELASAGECDAVLHAVREMFDLRRVQA